VSEVGRIAELLDPREEKRRRRGREESGGMTAVARLNVS